MNSRARLSDGQAIFLRRQCKRNMSPSSFLNNINSFPEYVKTEADEVVESPVRHADRQSFDFHLPLLENRFIMHKRQKLAFQELTPRVEPQSMRSHPNLEQLDPAFKLSPKKPIIRKSQCQRLEPIQNKRVDFKSQIMIIDTLEGIKEQDMDPLSSRSRQVLGYFQRRQA